MVASAFQTGVKDFDPGLLLSRVAPRLPAVLVWVLAIALGVQTALLVRNLIPQPPPAAPPNIASAAPRSVQPIDFQGILNAHLFGVAAADATPEGDASQAPQTQLSLVLTGTIAADDPKKGLGIIGESAANAKVYAVGAQLNGGARLHAVYADRVILDRGGQLEALMLPRQSFNTGLRAPPPRGASAGAMLSDRVRRMVDQDPGSIAEIMRPQPVFANGQQRGYRVYPGRNREHFARLGLRPGDLVTAINGTPLDDPQRGMEIFRTMGSASEVHVTVERNGRQQELNLNMAQLETQAQELENRGTENAPPTEQAEPPPPNPD